MPKVSSEYFDNKRKMIVEAAYQVCLIFYQFFEIIEMWT